MSAVIWKNTCEVLCSHSNALSICCLPNQWSSSKARIAIILRGVHPKLFSFVCSTHREWTGHSGSSSFLQSFCWVALKIVSTVWMEAVLLVNGTNILLVRMPVCAFSSTRLLCAPFKLRSSLMNFHTLPRSYPLSLDFDLWRRHDLKLEITQYGSIKYWIWGGKDMHDLGACVILHNYLRSQFSPFQATRMTVSLIPTWRLSQVLNCSHTWSMLWALTILSSSGCIWCMMIHLWSQMLH